MIGLVFADRLEAVQDILNHKVFFLAFRFSLHTSIWCILILVKGACEFIIYNQMQFQYHQTQILIHLIHPETITTHPRFIIIGDVFCKKKIKNLKIIEHCNDVNDANKIISTARGVIFSVKLESSTCLCITDILSWIQQIIPSEAAILQYHHTDHSKWIKSIQHHSR